MSLRTKIRGFTAWVNLRQPYEQLINNVLVDILSGTSMKSLLESLTGTSVKQLGSLDGLTQEQKQSRVEWMVKELKCCNVIPQDVYVDSKMFVLNSADHVFKFLWRLTCHDIWFVWEWAEYLQQEDEETLTQIPFKWTPESTSEIKEKIKFQMSLLSGSRSTSFVEEGIQSNNSEPKWPKFLGNDLISSSKTKTLKHGHFPNPVHCILELVQTQLKMTEEGRKIQCLTLRDLVDSRVLCALANSLVPNLFPTEILLNDRWTVNLVLRTIEKMFRIITPFDAQDLVEAEFTAICAYFCFFFMMAYKFKQCNAVHNQVGEQASLLMAHEQRVLILERRYKKLITDYNHLSDISCTGLSEIQNINTYKKAFENLNKLHDVRYCEKWVSHVQLIQRQLHDEIHDKIKEHYDVVVVPRNISINDLCQAWAINLSLTAGLGFFTFKNKESVNYNRKIILRNRNTGRFFADSKGEKRSVRKILKLSSCGTVDIIVLDYPQLEIFVESHSKHRLLANGSKLLYQVFPTHTDIWQQIFLRASKENDTDTVQRIVRFLKDKYPTFINSKESTSGNSALHSACCHGYVGLVTVLLDNNADFDLQNRLKCTPLHLAVENSHKRICQILLEWGSNPNIRNSRGLTAFRSARTTCFERFLREVYNYYSELVPQIVQGNVQLIDEVIENHAIHNQRLTSLHSRFVNGSTLLHTAAYYGHVPAIKRLLELEVDVNVRDFKGATALHHAKDVDTVEALLEAGAWMNAADQKGNTPLHMKCFGVGNMETSDKDSIMLLLNKGAKMMKQNAGGLLPIHCCAMQGYTQLISMLLDFDEDRAVIRKLKDESEKLPSLVYLALTSSSIDTAQWLLNNGLQFKPNEENTFLRKILTEEIRLSQRDAVVEFLLENGADAHTKFPDGNFPLHYAACLESSQLLDLLLQHGAYIDAENADRCTPLFCAVTSHNIPAASLLISRGASIIQKNAQGFNPLDLIPDYDEWINSGYFTKQIQATFRAYNLKLAKNLVQAIGNKVKMSASQCLESDVLPRPKKYQGRSRSASHTRTFTSPSWKVNCSRSYDFMNFRS